MYDTFTGISFFSLPNIGHNVLRWLRRGRPKSGRLKILRKYSEQVFSNDKNRNRYSVSTKLNRKDGGISIGLYGEFKTMGDFPVNYDISIVGLTLDEDRKTFSRVGRSIRNNLVKFADNLLFSYFKAPFQKSTIILMENESNQQLNENIKFKIRPAVSDKNC